MRPYLEKLPYEPGSSLCVLNRRLDEAIPFQWHHHPEYELTLTLNSRGQRFIGDHVGEYDHGDLVLVGPNLPHTWASRSRLQKAEPHIALVIWFHPDWVQQITQCFVEFERLEQFLSRAGRGLHFSKTTAHTLRESFEALFETSAQERVFALLRLLEHLSKDSDAQPLASTAVSRDHAGESRERISRVLALIHGSYSENLPLEELADEAALSISGVHRLFQKHVRTTISAYIMQLRTGDACARLSGTDQPINSIAHDVGYHSLANFNRQFKALKAMTPREYRAHFRISI